jgi:hypothetical protein
MNPKLILGAGKKVTPPSPTSPEEAPLVSAPLQTGPSKPSEYLTTEIMTLTGVSFSKYPFETLKREQEVLLVFDPYGKVVKPKEGHPDPTAVSVQDQEGRHIGYLKAAVAKVVTKALMSKKYKYLAKIENIKGGTQGFNYGVDIEVKFFANDGAWSS